MCIAQRGGQFEHFLKPPFASSDTAETEIDDELLEIDYFLTEVVFSDTGHLLRGGSQILRTALANHSHR